MTLLYLLSELKTHTQDQKLVCANWVSRDGAEWTLMNFTVRVYFRSLFPNINQLDALNFYNKFISSLCMFRAHVFIVRRAKLYYTVSGIITPTGGRPVHRLREDSQSVHRTATYRCDDTRSCIIQFCPPDDEHMCSKHAEAWNKLIIKFSASSWLILRNKYIEMHGQQNIKIRYRVTLDYIT